MNRRVCTGGDDARSVLETIITDAIERRGMATLAGHQPAAGTIVDWSFSDRIAVAERAGLISRGCARLPEVARLYRDQSDRRGRPDSCASVSARDAKLTSDVLHIVLRDLAPGRLLSLRAAYRTGQTVAPGDMRIRRDLSGFQAIEVQSRLARSLRIRS